MNIETYIAITPMADRTVELSANGVSNCYRIYPGFSLEAALTNFRNYLESVGN